MTDLNWLGTPPYATLIVLGVSALLSCLVSFINSRFTSKEKREQLKKWNKEIKDWSSESLKAKRTGDKKLLKKVQKQEIRIKQLQSKVAKQSLSQLKLMPVTLILFLLVWLGLTGNVIYLNLQLFTTPFSSGGPVALLPWLGGPIPLFLFQWYLICSLACGALFSRLFGMGMGME